MINNKIELYLSEPRFKMNIFERLLTRSALYCFYIVFLAIIVTCLISDIKWLFWLGILFLLFLIDKIIHFNQAEKSLTNLKLKPNQKINIAYYLSPLSLAILEKSLEKSLITNNNFFLQLLEILSESNDIQEGLIRMDINIKDFKEKINTALKEKNKIPQKESRQNLIDKIENLLQKAFKLSLENQEKFIEPRSLFSSLNFVNDKEISNLFNFFSIAPGDLENALIFGRFQKKLKWLKKLPSTLGGFAHKPYKIRHRVINRAWTSRPTPTLDKYSIDFTDLARKQKTGFLIGHEVEYDRLVDVLSRQTKANALLTGEAGSGKETLISHLAFELVKDKVPEPLFDKRLVSLQINNLVSGAPVEEISNRINKIVEEIISAGNIILYIPDIHNLSKTSGQQYLNAADILVPIIINDFFPVIGTTYSKEFKQFIEPQSDFVNAFELIRINEISEEEAIKLLTYDSIILENHYKILISFGAIKQAVILAHKYFRHKLLPSSAEDLLKEALADASQKKEKVLSADKIVTIAERKINIPIHHADEKEAEKLLNLENIIHQNLIDQEPAVKAVSQSLREYRSGLSRSGGPISVFLFVGPTGVGKTELSKILTKIQFGSEKMMIRFDMSEYQDKQSIFRFIGSPDGKITGILTEAIIQKPYSLILLDEFEKSHPDILNLFLQVFDEGRLTDNLGRVIDFTNTIIIATSNAHSSFIKEEIELKTPIKTIAEKLKKKLTDYFQPELLNRFSNIIVFKTLSISDIEAIAKLQLKKLEETVSENQGLNLIFEENAIKKIAELGFDPVFGARPLRGVISEKIRSPLAEEILKGKTSKGTSIKIILENDEIKLV
ncbi:ATP-dependent Clp protease ATP-binding subunit [Candidatus Wolfebacteria bacterium]|nr:ATP-dependent Clp protease ATP-binding subunit [Candidatus Wolfebacteria bacterium]